MMENLYTAYYSTKIGAVKITGTDGGILSVGFEDKSGKSSSKLPDSMTACLMQIDEYFNGKRKEFELPLLPEGTEFRKNVWQALLKIPYGETRSYKYIAVAINNEKAVRAVGAANGNNPIGIIVPCHRVIGSDGSLTGYAEGVWRKEWLLAHEQKFSNM